MSDSESKRKFFSGRSVEQAVVSAASHYGITSGELKYRELEKRHGFVRTPRKVVISVDPEDFRKAPAEAPPARRPAEAEAPRRATAPETPRRAEEPEEPEMEEPEVAEVAEAAEEAAPADEGEAAEPRRRVTRREEAPARRGRGPVESEAGGEAPAEPRRPRRERGRGRPAERPADRPADRARGGEPGRTPWWQARPVGETAEEDEVPEAMPEEEVFEEPVEEAGEEQPFEAGDEQPREAQPQAPARARGREERGDRYRFVERSEGLRRRGTPLPVAEPARPPAGGRPERRDEDRPRGRRRRGGRGGRPERRGPAPARELAREPALPPAPRPAPRAERLPPAEPEVADAAREALEVLLGFADVEAEADFFRNEDRLEVELWGPDDHLLLQDEGQLLLAIEHLLPRMLRGIYGDSMPVRVDCNDFHFEREERLRQLALRIADDVRKRGQPRTLEELDPAERRIVHMALADDPDVTTDSIGDGFYKRLKVLPK